MSSIYSNRSLVLLALHKLSKLSSSSEVQTQKEIRISENIRIPHMELQATSELITNEVFNQGLMVLQKYFVPKHYIKIWYTYSLQVFLCNFLCNCSFVRSWLKYTFSDLFCISCGLFSFSSLPLNKVADQIYFKAPRTPNFVQQYQSYHKDHLKLHPFTPIFHNFIKYACNTTCDSIM